MISLFLKLLGDITLLMLAVSSLCLFTYYFVALGGQEGTEWWLHGINSYLLKQATHKFIVNKEHTFL